MVNSKNKSWQTKCLIEKKIIEEAKWKETIQIQNYMDNDHFLRRHILLQSHLVVSPFISIIHIRKKIQYKQGSVWWKEGKKKLGIVLEY